jgi:hypothetical protein
MTQDFKVRLELIERNLRYLIELDLSDDEAQQDKLAMSFFYHFITKNQIQSLNISPLKGWAKTFTYETIVEQKLTKKKDTEITAAILAYSTLKNDKNYGKGKKQKIEIAIPKLLKKELTRNNLFFDRPNFTAMILYATQIAGIKIAQEETITKTLAEKYENLDEFSNISGVPFLITYLLKTGKNTIAKAIIDKTSEKIEPHTLEYDDALYLTHAIYQYHNKDDGLLKYFETIKKSVKETPIMISDIINKGDISDITVRDENRKISRLYKAIFIDLLEGIESHREDLEQKELDKRYSSETTYKGAAFSAFSLLCIAPATIFTYFFRTKLLAALDFWILQNASTTWNELTINTTLTFIDAYFITFAVTGTYALYKIILKEQINKDQRIKENFWASQKKVGKWFLKSVVVIFILGIITQLFTGAFQEFLKTNKP